MKERPILMSAPMARATLNDSKTQTRRLMETVPDDSDGYIAPVFMKGNTAYARNKHGVDIPLCVCPYGQPGDRLWVREAWRMPEFLDNENAQTLGLRYALANADMATVPVQYEADKFRRHWPWQHEPGRYRHARFMPRWACRTLLEVTGVRVERLQDISAEDAIAEGIEPVGCNWRDYLDHPYNNFTSPRFSYRSLWEQINGAGSWAANPWVWVVEFKRIDAAALRQAA